MSCVQFTFEPTVSLDEAEMSLHLARFAVEGIAGAPRVRMDSHYSVDHAGRTITIVGSRRLCKLIGRVYASLLAREFGDGAFQIENLDANTLEREAVPA